MIKAQNTGKRRVLNLALFFIVFASAAQTTYFQQVADHTITARLDDKAHVLHAYETIRYQNNSASDLPVIYMHLWPDAYSSRHTALAKQLLWQGKTAFHYASEERRGGIDSLDFRVNGEIAKWSRLSDTVDVCVITLASPLRPGQVITITTPFRVRLPDAAFSRLGHSGQAYYITQWFPKPAVYDASGWHPMPYLDQGEFYSEFGSYDVSITLPANYVVAATGNRVPDPIDDTFMHQKLLETEACNRDPQCIKTQSLLEFPKSADQEKTVRFVQRNVHDFAWFADKRFHVMKSEQQLPSGKKVATWCYFTNSNYDVWRKGVNYLNSSVLFYSAHAGEYAYDQVSAVDGLIMAGGGMEYPNITVINAPSDTLDLDVVITHEVGHNWFYGMLASNERRYPFLDEGINSYYEMRYVRERYPNTTLAAYAGLRNDSRLLGANHFPVWKDKHLLYGMSVRENNGQPLHLPADEYSSFNYGSMIYSKTPVVLDYISDLIGQEKFDLTMKQYFRKYFLKHPTPENFLSLLDSALGHRYDTLTSTLFKNDVIADYKVRRAALVKGDSVSVALRNRAAAPLPFRLRAFNGNVIVKDTVLSGFTGSRRFMIPAANADKIVVDAGRVLPEWNHANNFSRTGGLFRKCRPLKLRFLGQIEDPEVAAISYLPLFAGNYYNGFLAGVALHNFGLTQKRTEYIVAPMYGVRSRSLAGYFELNRNFFPRSVFRQITLGIRSKSFSYDEVRINGNEKLLNFYRVVPYLQFEFRKASETDKITHMLTLSSTQLFTDSFDTRRQNGIVNVHSQVHAVNYDVTGRDILHPYRVNVQLLQSGTMLRAGFTTNHSIRIARRNDIQFRLYSGIFLTGSEAERWYYAFRPSGASGWNDFLFEYNYIARNLVDGVGFSQFTETEGAMKVWTPFGRSTTWLASINVKSPKLFIPIRVFGDVVFTNPNTLYRDQVLWAAGINITLIRDVIEIYMPLFYSGDVAMALDATNKGFLQRIRFTLNIHKFTPRKILRENIFSIN